MKLRILLTSLLAFFCLSAFADNLTLNSLDRDGVTSLLKENTMTAGPGIYIKEKYVPNIISVYFAADGTLKGKLTNPAKGALQTDTGTWTVKDDGSMCLSWKTWGDYCQFIYPLKDHYIIVTTDQTKVVVLPKTGITKGTASKNS